MSESNRQFVPLSEHVRKPKLSNTQEPVVLDILFSTKQFKYWGENDMYKKYQSKNADSEKFADTTASTKNSDIDDDFDEYELSVYDLGPID